MPDVSFKSRENNRFKKITSDELFKNKRVVVFALPGMYVDTCVDTCVDIYVDTCVKFMYLHICIIIIGAYTPTCSTAHIPGYDWLVCIYVLCMYSCAVY